RIVKNRDFVSGDVQGIECDLLDHKDRLLAGYRYKLKGVVMKGWNLSLVDADESEIGRVRIKSGKVMAGEGPSIILSSVDGAECGRIEHKGLADAMAMVKQ